MPAWKAARVAGQSSRMGQIKERSDPKFGFQKTWWEEHYSVDSGLCFFCHKKAAGRRVGSLKMIGPVLFCRGCEKKYRSEKAFQETL